MELCTAHGRTSELPALIVQYYKKFCTKLVTYSDIVKYLEVLDEEARRGVYTEITAAADTAEDAERKAAEDADEARCTAIEALLARAKGARPGLDIAWKRGGRTS